jgi:Type IV secretion-system coupling protein DNA-binding domain
VQRAKLFSVPYWVKSGKGVQFPPYQADQIAALKSIISIWMRIAIFQTMGLGEGDCRIWFSVDELNALGAIDGLSDALPRLRKFGGHCALGLQSISQVSTTYGQGIAQTMIGYVLDSQHSPEVHCQHFLSQLGNAVLFFALRDERQPWGGGGHGLRVSEIV